MTQNGSRVYAISGGGLVKIGTSQSVTNRLRAIQSCSPVPLTLLASGHGGTTEERALHRYYATQRQHGEWFSLSNEQTEELIQLLQLTKSPPKILSANPKLRGQNPKLSTDRKAIASRAWANRPKSTTTGRRRGRGE